ncbi:MAG: hypothetical protein HRT87_00585 [Legionellales bacterium]|nr:hypothetical protein [Legionellales bacterium]
MKTINFFIATMVFLLCSNSAFAEVVLRNTSGYNSDIEYSAVFVREKIISKKESKEKISTETIEASFSAPFTKGESVGLLKYSLDAMPENNRKEIILGGYKLVKFKVRRVVFEVSVVDKEKSIFTEFLPTLIQTTYCQDPILGTLPTDGYFDFTFTKDSVVFR